MRRAMCSVAPLGLSPGFWVIQGLACFARCAPGYLMAAPSALQYPRFGATKKLFMKENRSAGKIAGDKKRGH